MNIIYSFGCELYSMWFANQVSGKEEQGNLEKPSSDEESQVAVNKDPD